MRYVAVMAFCLAAVLALAGSRGFAQSTIEAEDDAAAAEAVRDAGLADAAAIAAARRNMVRVILTDGSGHRLPSLVYEWTAGDGLVLEVSAARETIGQPRLLRRRLAGPRLLEPAGLRAALARSPVAGPPDPPEPAPDKLESFVVCVHATWAVIESIEAGRVVRRVRDACHPDPLLDRTLRLARGTFGLFADCRALTAARYRSDLHRLETCLQLHGDIGAAVGVRNRFDRLMWPEARAHDRRLDKLFAPAARLSWPGEEADGSRAAARLVAGKPDTFWPDRVVARSRNEASVEGRARHYSGDDNLAAFEAPFTQTWTRQGGDWRLSSWTFGPFTREP